VAGASSSSVESFTEEQLLEAQVRQIYWNYDITQVEVLVRKAQGSGRC
jgi:hypothetical protein